MQKGSADLYKGRVLSSHYGNVLPIRSNWKITLYRLYRDMRSVVWNRLGRAHLSMHLAF